jgi:hypothetical protein
MKPEPNPNGSQQDKELAQWLAGLGTPAPFGGKPLVVPDDLTPVKPMPAGWKFGLRAAGALALVSVVCIAALGTRGLRLMSAGQITAFAWVCMAVLGPALRWFYQEAKPGSRVLVTGTFAMTLVGVGVGGFLWLAFSLQPDWPHFLTSGLVCLSIGTASSVAAGWLLARIASAGFAVDARRASWAAGSLATLAGWIVLQIYCPKQEMAHLAAWHSAALVAGAATAAALTHRGFKLRA